MYFTNTSATLWNAFQGYIMYERIQTCPFTINPFIFENESQIIYLKYPFVSAEIQTNTLRKIKSVTYKTYIFRTFKM